MTKKSKQSKDPNPKPQRSVKARQKKTLSDISKDNGPPPHIQVSQQTHFSGPLPPPEMLEVYEQLHPGATKIVFEQFEAQSNHRREIEKLATESDIDIANQDAALRKTGQRMGMVIAMLGLGAVYLMVLKGYPQWGLGALVMMLCSIVSAIAVPRVFLRNRSAQDREK